METVSIQAELRENLGKQASKSFRRSKKVPVVIYGGGDSIHAVCDPAGFKSLVYTPEFRLAEVKLNGDTHKCILKDIQFHPVTEEILHADFQKLIEDTDVKVSIPLKVVGSSPGVKGGGKLIKLVRKVKIRTTPENLVDSLVVDITGLKLGHSKRISDIDVPEGVKIMNAPGIPVVSVEVPRALKSAKTAESKAGGVAAEGEEGKETPAEGGAE